MVTPGPISGASSVQDINARLVVFLTLKSKGGLSAAAYAQTHGYSSPKYAKIDRLACVAGV